MQAELQRSLTGLHAPDAPTPHYILYSLRRNESHVLTAAHGAILKKRRSVSPQLYVEVRVGDRQFDNVLDGGLDDRADERESADWTDAPDDLDPTALRVALWKLSQIKFDEALQDYYERKKSLVSEFLRHAQDSFSTEEAVVYYEKLSGGALVPPEFAPMIAELSRIFLQHPEIYDPAVDLRIDRQQRWLVTSDGTKVITEEIYLDCAVSAWILSKEGVYLESSRHLRRRRLDLPTREEIQALIDQVREECQALAEAESVSSLVGPALLSGQAASTMFHEALGHRLEGERLIARGETRTFAHKIGERILPPGFSVYDDPTLEDAPGQPWWGSYHIDDQGILAQRASLVEDGLLCGYLKSRTPTLGEEVAKPGRHHGSNGHGRHDGLQRPMARMANLVVEHPDSGKKSWDDLEAELFALAKAQGRDQALIIHWIRGGETSTNSYDFQVFKGELSHVECVDLKNGRRRRLHDLELIGTPLSALQRIAAAGGPTGRDEGYCYAESGAVAVAGSAPALLLTEVELQQRSTTGHREPLLSPPFASSLADPGVVKAEGAGEP